MRHPRRGKFKNKGRDYTKGKGKGFKGGGKGQGGWHPCGHCGKTGKGTTASDFLRGKNPNNLGNLLQPLESIPASRERVVPTEWKIRTVFGDCISRARVIPVPAHQYRQYALIRYSLDHAPNLSIQDEPGLATNWIKDRPEGLKLQNFSLATMTGLALSNLPIKLSADVIFAIYGCESLGPGQQLILLRESIGNCKDFHRVFHYFDDISCRICTSSASTFSVPHCARVSGHWFFWKEESGRQLPLFTLQPETCAVFLGGEEGNH